MRICAAHYDAPMHPYNYCAKCAEGASPGTDLKPVLPYWELSEQQFNACKEASKNPDGSENRSQLYLLLCQRYTLQHPPRPK